MRLGERCRALTFGIVGVLALVVGPGISSAQASTITSCTRAAVIEAVAAGGSHTFACDGRITIGFTVTNTVSLDANGHDVTFAGGYGGLGPDGPSRTERVITVDPGGELTLRGIDVADGLVRATTGLTGPP